MIAHQMFLVPRVLFHAFIIVYASEDNLTEAVEIRGLGHLWVEQLRHLSPRSALVVNLITHTI